MLRKKMASSPGLVQKKTFKTKLLLLGVLLMNMFCYIAVFASDNGIFDAMDNNTKTVVDRVVTTFNKSIAPVLLLILLLTIGLAGTNERVAAGAKAGIKWLVLIFVAINCLWLIINTITWATSKIKGKSVEGASIQGIYQVAETDNSQGNYQISKGIWYCS